MDKLNHVQVQSRSNDGDDTFHPTESFEAATTLAKRLRVPSNHMVCIEVNGERIKRWDRSRVEGENHWRATDPDEMETIGKIRLVHRVVR